MADLSGWKSSFFFWLWFRFTFHVALYNRLCFYLWLTMWGAINRVVEGCKKKEKHLAMLHFLGLGRVYFCAIFVISMVSVRQCVCIVDRFSFHNMNVTKNCRCWFDFTQTNTLFRQTVFSSVSPVTEHKNVWVSLLTNTLRCCSYTANWKKNSGGEYFVERKTLVWRWVWALA